MPSASGIVYTINADGNAPAALKELVEKLNAVKPAAEVATSWFDRFNSAAKKLNQNAAVSNLETMSALFIQFGGNVSRVSSIVTSLIRPMAVLKELFGGVSTDLLLMGGSMAGAVVGAYAIEHGLISLADGAVKAKDELEKFNAQMDPAIKRQIDAYTDSTDSLSIAMDKLSVSVGAGIAQKLGAIKQAMAEGVTDTDSFVKKLQAIINGTPGTLMAGGTSPLFGNIGPSSTVGGSSGVGGGLNAMAMSGSFGSLIQLATTAGNAGATMLSAFEATNEQMEKLKQGGGEYVDVLGDVIKHEREATAELIKQVTAQGQAKDYSRDTLKEKTMVGHGELGSSVAMAPYSDLLLVVRDTVAKMEKVGPAFSDAMDSMLLRLWPMIDKATKQASVTATKDVLSQIINPLSDLKSLVSGAHDLIENSPADLTTMLHDSKDMFADFGPRIGDILRDVLPDLIESLPELMGNFVMDAFGPAMTSAIITSLPAITKAFFVASIQAIPTWVHMVSMAWKGFTAELRGEIARAAEDIITAVLDVGGNFLGTHLGTHAKGHRELFGQHVNPIHFGGGGRHNAQLGSHQATQIGPDRSGHSVGAQNRGSGGGHTLNVGSIHINASDPRKVAEQLRAVRGPYGFGIDISKLAG